MIIYVLPFHPRLSVHLHAHRSVSSYDAGAAVQAVELRTRCKSQERVAVASYWRINKQVNNWRKQKVKKMFAAQCCS